jgi:hypothetical protein
MMCLIHTESRTQRDVTSSEPAEKYASLMGKNESVPNKEAYDEQYRRCVGENPDLFALDPFKRPPHLTLHAVGGFKLAKVLAILITVFYTDKQMAKVRRKTECLS